MKTATEFWDAAAEKYSKAAIEDMDGYNYTLDRTRSYLKPTDIVLEVGCGTGSTALLLAPSVKHITGTDVSGNMIKIANDKVQQEGTQNISFAALDVFDDSQDQGPYDVVLAHNLLHLLEDVPAAINRFNGLLKPGGLFISKTFCQDGGKLSFKMKLMMMALPIAQMLGKAPFVNMMSITELETMISNSGFEIIETGNYPATAAGRYIVARKS